MLPWPGSLFSHIYWVWLTNHKNEGLRTGPLLKTGVRGPFLTFKLKWERGGASPHSPNVGFPSERPLNVCFGPFSLPFPDGTPTDKFLKEIQPVLNN